MYSRLKKLCLLLTLISTQIFAIDFHYNTSYYPNELDLTSIQSRNNNVILEVDAYYPTLSETKILKSINLKHLIIHAAHFPTINQIRLLESLDTSYELILDEVFPSMTEVSNINKSNVKRVTVQSWDFPTTGEVEIFNNIKVPFSFEILRKDLPLPEHMIVIKQFNPKTTVIFNHKAFPGIGYANFFNDLKTYKHFKVMEMPYGEDYIGANGLTKTTFEVSTDNRPMPYESIVFNLFKIAPTINFTNAFPFDQKVFQTIKLFNSEKTIIKDIGSGILFDPIYQVYAGAITSDTVFSFNRF